MHNAAKKEGLTILSVSPYRNNANQIRLFEQYSRNEGREKALTYTALPGNSEHESGLTLDVRLPKYGWYAF